MGKERGEPRRTGVFLDWKMEQRQYHSQNRELEKGVDLGGRRIIEAVQAQSWKRISRHRAFQKGVSLLRTKSRDNVGTVSAVD